jgi:hypothetical protein
VAIKGVERVGELSAVYVTVRRGEHKKRVLDFAFFRLTESWRRKKNGVWLEDWHSYNTSGHRTCKKPDESWADRKKR